MDKNHFHAENHGLNILIYKYRVSFTEVIFVFENFNANENNNEKKYIPSPSRTNS